MTYASPVDAGRFGEHRSRSSEPGRFFGRIGDSAHPAIASRYHLYLSWACPASHRLAILRRLAGLEPSVSVSYVDSLRDGRGWAFRPATGPDQVNGFALLRQAYEASEPGYDGPVTVPVLWDRVAGDIVSTDPIGIGVDLATRLGAGAGLHPARQRPDIHRLGERIRDEVERLMLPAVYRPESAAALRATLDEFDDQLSEQRFLLGERLTDADVRLWVLLARYDAGPNACGAIGPHLDAYAGLWRWAQELYRLDAFHAATDFRRFASRLTVLPPWDARPRTRTVGAA